MISEPIYIQHRINTIDALRKVPNNYGVELDLRDYGDRLVMVHDAFKDGELFEPYLLEYGHRLMVLNVKCEGVEDPVYEMIQKKGVENYFFLDLSFPAIMKLIRQGESKIAVRFSEFESLESCLLLKDKVDWIWVDCFNDLPINKHNYEVLKENYKLCLVSPELQGYATERIFEFKQKLSGFEIDAICTKRIDLWKS